MTSAADPTDEALTTGPGPDGSGARILDVLTQMEMGTLNERMGVELLEATAERAVGRMPVAGNTQPYGILHGGASAVLAETLGSVAAFLQAGPGRVSLGLELSCTHHRAVREGYVTGTATALSLGQTIAAYDIRIVDDQERPVCTARLTCLLRDA